MSISVGDTVDDFAAIRFIFAWSVILHEKTARSVDNTTDWRFFDSLADGE